MVIENYLGLECPEPVMRCREFLSVSHPPQFMVMVDNEASVENVERFLKKSHYHVSITQESPQKWLLHATNKDPSSEPQTQTAVLGYDSKKHDIKTLVIIASLTFGHGDDNLGVKLMENFITTLPELGENLWKIILLNGGVKFATTEGKVLEALKRMSESGVEILVCGGCLEYYSIKNMKKIGETTNMLDVVTAIDLADKVIRP